MFLTINLIVFGQQNYKHIEKNTKELKPEQERSDVTK